LLKTGSQILVAAEAVAVVDRCSEAAVAAIEEETLATAVTLVFETR